MDDVKKYDEAEFAVGVEIEHEHQPTYDMIKKVLEETGKLPEAIEVFTSIAKDHLNEHGNYYNDEVGLPNMERELTELEGNEDEEISEMVDEGMPEEEIVSKILDKYK